MMADELITALDEQADSEWEVESEEGSLWTGSRLLIGATAMMWAAVAFSYFYLRAEDQGAAWRPHTISPPFLLGTIVAICAVGAAAFFSFGAYKLRQGLAFEWSVAAWLGVGLGLVATGIQVWDMTRMGFYPGEAGYTSVFVGFGLLNIGFLLGAVVWPESIVARSHRLRAKMHTDEYFGLSVQPEMRLLRASLRGAVLFWWFVSAVEIFFWFLFYVLH